MKRYSEKLEINAATSFPDTFDYIPSNTTDESIDSSDDNSKSRDTSQRNFSLVITFCAIALFIILVNFRVFRIVTKETLQKNRSINFLVAHLSFLAIGFTCVIFIYVMEKSNVFSMTAPGLCEFLSFLRNIVLSLFPLNSVAITYVRTRYSRSNLSNIILFLTILLIWTVAIVGSLPSIFMVTYTIDLHTNLEKCKQIPLLGTFEATLAYEVFRFVVYHLLVCSYMAYAMITIRSRIQYLYINKPIPNKMKRRVQRVRFVYLHSIIFILIWLPTGLVLGLYKLRTRIEWMADYINVYLTALVVLSSSLFILSPLVYVILHEESSAVIFKGLGSCVNNCKRNEKAANEQADMQSKSLCLKENKTSGKNGPSNKMIKRKIVQEATGDISRISTAAVSGTSDRSITIYTHIKLRCSTNLSALKNSSLTGSSETRIVQTSDVRKQAENMGENFAKETMV